MPPDGAGLLFLLIAARRFWDRVLSLASLGEIAKAFVTLTMSKR